MRVSGQSPYGNGLEYGVSRAFKYLQNLFVTLITGWGIDPTCLGFRA